MQASPGVFPGTLAEFRSDPVTRTEFVLDRVGLVRQGRYGVTGECRGESGVRERVAQQDLAAPSAPAATTDLP